MNIFERINMLGDAIAQHHFTGSFDGAALALYAIEGDAAGTHFVALIDPDITQIMPITSEAEARATYHQMVAAIHAEQDA
jgi:hypothetical protein